MRRKQSVRQRGVGKGEIPLRWGGRIGPKRLAIILRELRDARPALEHQLKELEKMGKVSREVLRWPVTI